jgi:hypothetical protein
MAVAGRTNCWLWFPEQERGLTGNEMEKTRLSGDLGKRLPTTWPPAIPTRPGVMFLVTCDAGDASIRSDFLDESMICF